ncbi:hypothetical protein [Neisseria lactamica]|uniref:hypothetical protein n=1 Tax=Neisseria lactamica TaxID=486 RepID=UPI00128FF649|nr:hypothetical protein [Neisseria lactamica]
MRLKTIRNGQTRSGLFFCRGDLFRRGGLVCRGGLSGWFVSNGRVGFSPPNPECRLKPDKAFDAV